MPKIVDKTKKMASISDAALKVFKSKGYHKTRIVDIARGVGIGKGTIYEYFKDKEDILRFSMTRYFSVFTSGILETIKDKDRAADKLFAILDFAIRHADEWEDHCTAYLDYYRSAGTDTNEKFSVSCMYQEMKLMLTQLIRDAQTDGAIDQTYRPEITAQLLVSLYDGIILHRLFEERTLDRESLRSTAVKLIQTALLKGGTCSAMSS